MSPRGSHRLVIAALAANAAIAAAKIMAVSATGSAALFAETVHSLVAVASQTLLLLGLSRTQGRLDLHFWSLGVAVLLYAFGSGIAIYEGALRLGTDIVPAALGTALLVLAVALALICVPTWQALAEVEALRGSQETDTPAPPRALEHPALHVIVIESIAAIAGLAVALMGLLACIAGIAAADAAAALVTGLILAAAATLMSIDIRRLIVGAAEAAHEVALSEDASAPGLRDPRSTAGAISPPAKPTTSPPAHNHKDRKKDRRKGA